MKLSPSELDLLTEKKVVKTNNKKRNLLLIGVGVAALVFGTPVGWLIFGALWPAMSFLVSAVTGLDPRLASTIGLFLSFIVFGAGVLTLYKIVRKKLSRTQA
ncbi:MAG TPA: hypothetical protein VJC12_01870 [Candidatus Paceibacterota bacterium]